MISNNMNNRWQDLMSVLNIVLCELHGGNMERRRDCIDKAILALTDLKSQCALEDGKQD